VLQVSQCPEASYLCNSIAAVERFVLKTALCTVAAKCHEKEVVDLPSYDTGHMMKGKICRVQYLVMMCLPFATSSAGEVHVGSDWGGLRG